MLEAWSDVRLPLLGMVHLPALPGSPRATLDAASLIRWAVSDARVLAAGGVDGLMIENFGDVPFFKDQVPRQTIAWITRIAAEVRSAVEVPLGINVLRNDALSALAIAHAVEAQFIRVNILTSARLTDQGIIEGRAADLQRLRRLLGADSIRILADIDVKHSTPLGPGSSLEDEARDTVHRGLADGLILSGSGTGRQTDAAPIAHLKNTVPGTPLFIGSGVTAENLQMYREADGIIAGSWLKQDGQVDRPVDPARVQALVEARDRITAGD
ncbi:MAG: BtpA/SgcQ family protein [Phycisphaeraceae bacterium]|nr:BtpA/SgcQ family protein [Phycisphaeraceae bacterium]